MYEQKKPLASGINLPDRKNQFDILDFSSELGSDEKKIRNQVFAEKIYPMIKVFDHLPTHTPSNLNEQFAIYNGVFYVYINGTWTAMGSSQYATGRLVREAATGTGTQEITVGFQPKLIKITARCSGESLSIGTANASLVNRLIFNYYDGAWQFNSNDVYIIYASKNNGGRGGEAVVSAIGATSFTLNWSYVDADTHFIWECYG